MTISYRLAQRLAQVTASAGHMSDYGWNFERRGWKITREERDARHAAMAERMAPYGFKHYNGGIISSKLESGHTMLVRLTPETNHWHAVAYHTGDPESQETWIHLGPHDEQVPEMYGREMRNRETVGSLQQQWRRAAENGDPTGEHPERRVRPGTVWHAGDVHSHYADQGDDGD